jgi:hypothetical protein
MENIKLGNFEIGENCKPFVIAEMSGNHNQSIQRAFDIVKAAAESGAHALKLQTYTPDTMTVKGALTINDSNSLWNGRELYDLYNEAFTPWEWHKDIFSRAKKKGLICFSTPFDESSVDVSKSNFPWQTALWAVNACTLFDNNSSNKNNGRVAEASISLLRALAIPHGSCDLIGIGAANSLILKNFVNVPNQ